MIAFRPARPGDEALVRRFVLGIAEAEGEVAKVRATEADYAALLFDEDPALRGLIAEVDGAPCGMALWHWTAMTYQGRRALYLDDLFVDHAHRKRGVGRALMAELARVAAERAATSIDWLVHRDNGAGAGFYAALGAHHMAHLNVYRVNGPALAALASERAVG